MEDARAAFEFPDRLVDAGGFDDAAVARDVAVEDREAAVLAVGVRDVTDAATLAIGVGVGEVLVLGESDLRGDAARRRERALLGGGRRRRALDVVLIDGF